MNIPLRHEIFEEANYMCQCGRNCGLRATESHHILEQRKYNIKIFGKDRIESKENIRVVSRKCHIEHSQWDKDIRRNLINKWNKELELEKYNNLF